MKLFQIPRRTIGAILLGFLTVLTSGPLAEIAADDGPPARPAPPAAPRIEVIGGGQFQIQLNAGAVRLAVAANADPELARRLGQPPVIFLLGFPFHPLPNLTAAKAAEPGYLGVQLETTPADEGDAADPKEKDPGKKNKGVGVLGVLGDSPAAKAGVKEGDRVLAIEGKAVKDSTQLREAIRAAKSGQVVKLTVRRDGKEIDLKATLAAFPEPGAIVQFAGQNAPAAVPGIVFFNRTPSSAQRLSTTAADTGKDVVSLRDGNRFPGTIQRIDPAKGVFLHRESGPDLELLEEAISSLTFADREKGAPAPSTVGLQLRDGSSFRGDALTMEGGKIRLTLPGGQRLEFPQEQALAATLSDGQAPQTYEGPTSLAGWLSGRSIEGNWEYKDGFLRCINNGPIGRNLGQTPDPVELSFDILYPPKLQHFGITLFAAGPNQNTSGTLTMQFSPNRITGNHFDGRRYNQYSADVQQDDAQAATDQSATVRYRLLVDRVNGKALIFVNGIKRADWNLSKVKPEEIGKCGPYFSVSPNVFTSNNSFRVGRIHVFPWDGREPADGEKTAEPKTDQILRSHGPSIDGKIGRITEREIILREQSRSVPREKTLHVRFAASTTPPAEPPPAVAMVRLKNGSEFAATKLTATGEAMTLATRFESPITLPLSALRDLDFLPRPGQPEPSATGNDVLTLTDGTQLKGALLTPIQGGSVRWKIAASRAPLEFHEASVAGVLLSRSENSPLSGSSAVRLADGDWLPGDIVSLDSGRLILRNELSQQLSFPLTAVRSLYLAPGITAAVADGATGPGLWSNGRTGTGSSAETREIQRTRTMEELWLYHDGAYTLKNASSIGSAALAKKWPAYSGAYALNFDVENPSRTASFNLQVLNSKDDRTFTVYSFGGRVNVYFNPSSPKFNRFAGGAKRFQADEQARPEGKILRVSLVSDRPAKTFRVFMDDKEIGKIPFKAEEADEALEVGAISLIPMASGVTGGPQSRIANIWTAPWAGPVAKEPETSGKQQREEAQPAAGSASPPIVHLANGDEFAGRLEGITPDFLIVNSEAGRLELPRERVAWLNFPGPQTASPARFPRLRFHDRGMLSIQDLQIGEGRVTCRTLQGETLEFPLRFVKEVVLRPVNHK